MSDQAGEKGTRENSKDHPEPIHYKLRMLDRLIEMSLYS